MNDRRRSVLRFAAVTAGMFGFGFALVPLYGAVCDLVGFNGRSEGMLVSAAGLKESPQDRLVTVELLTSVNGALPMQFSTAKQQLRVQPGKLYTVSFTARNDAGQALVAQAVPSVAPWSAAKHLKKTECFCFRQQPFAAGEERAMPMRFMLDPELPAEVQTVTLSYTLFDVTEMAARDAGRRS